MRIHSTLLAWIAAFAVSASPVAAQNVTDGGATPNSTIGGQSIAPGGSTTNQGNGGKLQLSTGSTTTNDCVKYDANSNTVDSGGACGAGSFTPADPLYISTYWYPLAPYGVVTGNALTSGTTYWREYTPTKNVTVTDAGIRLVATSASGNCQFFMHNDNAATARPTGTNIGATGTPFSTTTAGVLSASFTSAIPLTANTRYWLGIQCDNSAATFSVSAASTNLFNASTSGVAALGNALPNNAQGNAEFRTTGTYPTIPSGSFTVTDNATSGSVFTPAMFLKVQ